MTHPPDPSTLYTDPVAYFARLFETPAEEIVVRTLGSIDVGEELAIWDPLVGPPAGIAPPAAGGLESGPRPLEVAIEETEVLAARLVFGRSPTTRIRHATSVSTDGAGFWIGDPSLAPRRPPEDTGVFGSAGRRHGAVCAPADGRYEAFWGEDAEGKVNALYLDLWEPYPYREERALVVRADAMPEELPVGVEVCFTGKELAEVATSAGTAVRMGAEHTTVKYRREGARTIETVRTVDGTLTLVLEGRKQPPPAF